MTLRMMVRELEQRDVVIYVEVRPLHRKIAGRLTWMAKSGGFRYVRVQIGRSGLIDTTIAVLGHELQHALEIACDPTIVDGASLAAFYATSGIAMRNHSGGWDTEGARLAGRAVGRERARNRASHPGSPRARK